MKYTHLNETLSPWHEHTYIENLPTLQHDHFADVCVIGGGIAGLTTAYLLQQEGYEVCLLERALLTHGQSGRSTAHLTTVLDRRYSELIELHGADNALLIAESHREAINLIEKIVRTEKINCGMRRTTGYLFADREENLKILKKEYAAAQRAGVSVYLAERAPFTHFNTGPALAFPQQMQLDPVCYLQTLAEIILKNGGNIFTNSPVERIESGIPAKIHVNGGHRVTAASVVIATHTPINDLFSIHSKQAPYRTYVLAFDIPPGSVPNGIYWDTSDPYHYIRTVERDGKNSDLLIVGGEDHKTGQDDTPQHRFDSLEYWARLRFPKARKLLYRWSGQIMESVDGLAYLGRNPMDYENIYVITGDSGNGLTNCTIGARLIADMIAGRKNPYEKIYDPARISLQSVPALLRENSNVLSQYRDWFRAGTRPDVAQMPNSSGTVYRDGLSMIALYKDPNGGLAKLSAACPHLGGVVHWNPVEKSWDCPCHGSRFSGYGDVLEGPATEGLKKIREEKNGNDRNNTLGPNT